MALNDRNDSTAAQVADYQAVTVTALKKAVATIQWSANTEHGRNDRSVATACDYSYGHQFGH